MHLLQVLAQVTENVPQVPPPAGGNEPIIALISALLMAIFIFAGEKIPFIRDILARIGFGAKPKE